MLPEDYFLLEVLPSSCTLIVGQILLVIGITRCILDSMLLKDRYTQLTHKVLVTLMSEVTAIINAQPLVPVSTDTKKLVISQLHRKISTMETCSNTSGNGFKPWQKHSGIEEGVGTLQSHCMWFHKHHIIKEGDIVPLNDK